MRVTSLDSLSGKIPLIEPDEEPAGIQARAGFYKSKRLGKLGILEDAQTGHDIVAPPVQLQLDFPLRE